MKQKFYSIILIFLCQIMTFAQVGEVLNFDGTNDQVNLGNSLSAEIDPLNTITVEAWVYPTQNTGNGLIVGNYAYPTDNGQEQFMLRRDGTSYKFYLNDGITQKVVSAPSSVTLNTWTHVACVWDGSTTKIYINGVLQGTTTGVTGSSFRTLTNSFVIGFTYAGSPDEAFTGSIDEVRIWSTVRTQTEIDNNKSYELSLPQTGLLRYYKFNQGIAAGNNAGETLLTDFSSNANNGTLINFTLTGSASNWLGSSPVSIRPATHLNFDGVDDYTSVAAASGLPLGNASRTIEAWVKTNSTTTGTIVNYGNQSANQRFGILSTSSGVYIVGEGNDYSTGFAINDNNWHHVAVTFNGTDLIVYVDGVVVGSTTKSYNTTGSLLSLGATYRTSSWGEFCQGNIDEVRIWNTVRTAEQINGSKNCELQGTETGLVAYYKLNQGNDATNNTSVTTLNDATANANNGTLVNFTLTGATSNWLAGSSITTGSIVPSNATVTTPVVYNQGDSATALTATTGTNGTGLLWYTTATGGIGSTTAPTPNTATVGNTSYWVSSTNANGCESVRTEIVVNVALPATHLNFDGTNDYVQVPAGINVANSSFTVEFMAKRNATNVNNYVLKQGNQVTNDLLHIGFRDNNDFTFAFWYNDINIPVVNYVADANWHHWSCVYNNVSGTRQVYQDGILVASDSGVVPYTGTGIIQIGSFDGSSFFYNGGIDDLRIWNTVRTAEQINGSKNCELQGSETGLVAYYKFNQGLDAVNNTSVTTLTDATTNAYNGTLTNFALTGATSNFLAGSPVTTGSIVPSNATVTTPVTYNQGATASTLTATTGSNGTGLLWYTAATGGTGSTTAPTPNTATVGNTSYWVSSTNANGCESVRTEIVVTVNASITGCWKHVFRGGNQTYAIGNDGTLWSWGFNAEAQLGLGDTSNRVTPTQIGTANNWKYLSSGDRHVIALKEDGTLWAWGRNVSGQLGLGDTSVRNVPVQVGMDTDWNKIHCGANNSLAVKTDGTLWSWGYNNEGQLGLGDTTQRLVPTQVGMDTNWSSVVGTGQGAFAIKTDGTLWGTGFNLDGQLGLGDYTQRLSFVQIGADTNWEKIYGGFGAFTLAIKTDGTLWSTGNGAYGQLGQNTTSSFNTFTQVGTDTDWNKIATANSHSMAIKDNGTLWTWGRNNSGQLGFGDTSNRLVPTQVGVMTNWYEITGGDGFLSALNITGEIWATGNNWAGQLGLGDTTNRNVLVQITCPTVLGTTNFNVSDNINLYPNPTNGNVNIMVNNLTNVSVSVYDLNGRQILNKELAANENAVDISNFQTGMYLFKIKSTEGETVKKVIKN